MPFLADNASGTPASDPPPPEQTSKAISLQVSPEYFTSKRFIAMTPNAEYLCFQAPILFDAPPIGKKFGAVLSDVQTSAPYHAGDVVSAEFVGANPRVSEF